MTLADARLWFRYRCKILDNTKRNRSSQWEIECTADTSLQEKRKHRNSRKNVHLTGNTDIHYVSCIHIVYPQIYPYLHFVSSDISILTRCISIKVFFHCGCLPLRSSSIGVIFHRGHLPLRTSSIEGVFH